MRYSIRTKNSDIDELFEAIKWYFKQYPSPAYGTELRKVELIIKVRKNDDGRIIREEFYKITFDRFNSSWS